MKQYKQYRQYSKWGLHIGQRVIYSDGLGERIMTITGFRDESERYPVEVRYDKPYLGTYDDAYTLSSVICMERLVLDKIEPIKYITPHSL